MKSETFDPKQIVRMMEKAEESLQGASVLAKERMYAFAVSRAYYAVFYSAEAALVTKN